MGIAVKAQGGPILHRNTFPIVFLDISKQQLHFFPGLAGALPMDWKAFCGQKAQKRKQFPLNPQLVAIGLIPAQCIQTPDAFRQRRIILHTRLHMDRAFNPAFGQGQEELCRAHILVSRHEHGWAEYDILIFHCLPARLADSMQLSRKYSNRIPGPHLVGNHVHRDQTTPLFYGNDFHFLMPMDRHQLKIKGNGARINIKREITSRMFLNLMVIIIMPIYAPIQPVSSSLSI